MHSLAQLSVSDQDYQ